MEHRGSRVAHARARMRLAQIQERRGRAWPVLDPFARVGLRGGRKAGCAAGCRTGRADGRECGGMFDGRERGRSKGDFDPRLHPARGARTRAAHAFNGVCARSMPHAAGSFWSAGRTRSARRRALRPLLVLRLRGTAAPPDPTHALPATPREPRRHAHLDSLIRGSQRVQRPSNKGIAKHVASNRSRPQFRW